MDTLRSIWETIARRLGLMQPELVPVPVRTRR
jgi:hypothetical protein